MTINPHEHDSMDLASVANGLTCPSVGLNLAMTEMYTGGAFTRKVAEIMEQLCGLDVSSGQVS